MAVENPETQKVSLQAQEVYCLVDLLALKPPGDKK